MNISKNTFFQDCRLVARCAWGLPRQESRQLEAYYRNRYLIRLFFLPAEEIVRYTRIFTAALICWFMQQIGAKKQVRYWKYHTNERIISLARSSLTVSICQAGWGSAPLAVVLSILCRRGFEILNEDNLRNYRKGYREVENNELPPIILSAFFKAQKLRIDRVRHYMKVAVAYLVYQLMKTLGIAQGRSWRAMIRSSSKLLKNKLDIPFQEIAMFNPSLTQETLLQVSHLAEQLIITLGNHAHKLQKRRQQVKVILGVGLVGGAILWVSRARS